MYIETFAAKIRHNFFAKKPLIRLEQDANLILKNNILLYLFNRTKNLLEVLYVISLKIKNIATYVLQISNRDFAKQNNDVAKLLINRRVLK